MDEQTLYAKATIKAEGKKLVGIASSEAEDRHGEVVSLSGWDLKNAKKNCPLLWAHDHSQLPLGTVERFWTEGDSKASGSRKRLMFEAVISDATERGRAVRQLIEEGILKAFSVGFRGLEMDDNKFTKQELLEISVVNVPANPDALMLAYKSLNNQGVSDATIKELGIPVGIVKTVFELETRVKTLEQSAKEFGNSAPQVDKDKVTSRLSVLKGMSRKADELLAGEKKGGIPRDARVTAIKILKRSSDLLIASHKKEL